MGDEGGGREIMFGAENATEVDYFGIHFYHWYMTVFGYFKLFSQAA